MCGFAGYIGNGSREILEAMTGLLSHRGPDDRGVWMQDGIGLAHTRLSILDLSSAGRQPMVAPDGSCAAVYNGEIYNFREIRRELRRQGEVFTSDSDTEVLLLGYCRWGKGIIEKLRGMFAFAIWDFTRRELFLARDRVGIKPLFYTRLDDGLVFASEIKAVLAHPGVCREMNPAALDSYFELGYIPAPDTAFRGIRALEPGCWLEYGNGALTTRRYWAPNFIRSGAGRREDDLLEELDEHLNDAVKSHLVSDVPVGAFLSGGIDSSLVCAMAQKRCPEPIHTFTIGFDGGGEECRYARTVAAHVGCTYHEVRVTPDIVGQLPQLMRFLEQPLFDNSILPSFLVSQQARKRVKVVLSGDGGDEPFCGYDWTRFALLGPAQALVPSASNGWRWAYRRGPSGLSRRLLHDLARGANDRYRRRVSTSPSWRSWIYCPEFHARLDDGLADSTSKLLQNAPVRDERDRFAYVDLRRYLPGDVLFKVDRMSMANSLEVRVPLLDHRLLEWVLQLPFDMRFRHGRGKHLLRRLAARYLPAEVLKPRKQGFTVPVGRWLLGELGGWVENLFRSEPFQNRRIVRPQAALELLEMHRSRRYDVGHRIWQIVVMEVWARQWLDRMETTVVV